MKTIRCRAELLTIRSAQIINPMGSPLAAKDRSGMPLSMGATGERYRLEFLLEDGTKWETTVTGAADLDYRTGTKGILVRKGKALKYWVPEDKEEKFLQKRRRKIRAILLSAAAALVILTAGGLIAGPYVFGRKAVSWELRSPTGRMLELSLRPNPGWIMTKTDDGTVEVRTKNTLYTVSLPADAEYIKARNQLQDEYAKGAAARYYGYSKVEDGRPAWIVESFDTDENGEHQMSFIENPYGNRRLLVQSDSLVAGKDADGLKIISRISASEK